MSQNDSATWICKTHIFASDEYICSSCGTSVQKPSRKCPKCGRQMKSGKQDLHWIDEMEEFSAMFED